MRMTMDLEATAAPSMRCAAPMALTGDNGFTGDENLKATEERGGMYNSMILDDVGVNKIQVVVIITDALTIRGDA